MIELQESQDVRAQNPALRILDGNRVRIAAIYSRIETRNSVKMIPFAFLFFAALAWAGGGSHSADYTVNVHVSSSSTDRGGHQLLDVVIDAKKYELRSELSIGYLLESATTRRSSLRTTTRPRTIPLKSTSFCSPTKRGRMW